MKKQLMNISQKRQYYHNLLISLGQVEYKAIIIEGSFPGIEHTTDLSEAQLDQLITDAEGRLGNNVQRPEAVPQKPRLAAANDPEETAKRKLRNKCLLVLAERNIKATAKDWTPVNHELEAKRYQWVLTEEQRQKGYVNKRGLGAFATIESLKKLFYQLCSIRDNEKESHDKVVTIATQN
ncbi:MAG: hypothetical protein WCG93_12085 [Paludibacter sp.]